MSAAIRYNLVLQHKLTGEAWDISDLATSITYETKLRGQNGRLTIKLRTAASSSNILLDMGDIIYLDVNGTRIFWGFIFERTQNRLLEKSIVAHDQIRYLAQTRTSDVFSNVTTDQILRKTADRFKLICGDMERGSYLHTDWIHDDAKILDIIDNSCAMNYKYSKDHQILVLYDDSGKLRLATPPNIFPNWQQYVIGDGSLLTDYDYKQSIDSNTFNSILMEKSDPPAGTKSSVGSHYFQFLPPVESAENIKQWGMLQKVIKVTKQMSTQQMAQEASTYLSAYNRPLDTLSIKSMGIPGVRAGCLLPINISDLDGMTFLPMLMDSVTHTLTQNDHQMSLEMRLVL
jgi:hypothetical protein